MVMAEHEEEMKKDQKYKSVEANFAQMKGR